MDRPYSQLTEGRPLRGTIDWALLWQISAFVALISGVMVAIVHVHW